MLLLLGLLLYIDGWGYLIAVVLLVVHDLLCCILSVLPVTVFSSRPWEVRVRRSSNHHCTSPVPWICLSRERRSFDHTYRSLLRPELYQREEAFWQLPVQGNLGIPLCIEVYNPQVFVTPTNSYYLIKERRPKKPVWLWLQCFPTLSVLLSRGVYSSFRNLVIVFLLYSHPTPSWPCTCEAGRVEQF